MFEQYDNLFLQKQPILKLGKRYYIFSNDQILGTIEESKDTIYDLKNQLLSLTSLSNLVSLVINVLDPIGNILGTIKKRRGYYNDFQCYLPDDEKPTIIKPELKIKSSKITVSDENGHELVVANSGYGATDFTVIDHQTTQVIATIKRRSKVYHTVKENLLHDDGYYITKQPLDPLLTLSLIAMVIIIDMYYFNH